MLLDPSILWLEIDSTLQLPGIGLVPIDDIVIHFADGRLVCCQCKKNEPNYKAWTVSSLGDELEKAGQLLRGEPTAEVRFYSRADFGALLTLKTNASGASDASSFEASLGATIQDERNRLAAKWDTDAATQSQTLYAFLGRTSFEFRPPVEELETQVSQRLAQHVTRPKEGLHALWYALEHLGAHIATAGSPQASVHRLTRDGALKVLHDAGCELGATRDTAQALAELKTASAVGRSWRRDIGGQQISRAATNELLQAIDRKERTLLLTDGPGAGKTCILLDLVEKLEARPHIATLLIQAREYSEANSAPERESLGLPEDIPETVSSLSNDRHVVVVVDSLDVLALARENTPLAFFLSLLDRLSSMPNTTTVVACRSFDVKYDRRLAARKWNAQVIAGALDWKDQISPVLVAAGLSPGDLDERTRALLANARHLALFVDLASRSGVRNLSGTQELTEAYLDEVVLNQPELGQDAMVALESMATLMLAERVSDIPRSRFGSNDELTKRLQSEQVILPTQAGKRVAFGHQTLLDALSVRAAIRSGQSLLGFIQSLPAVPFIRPTVRAYFNHLRLGDVTQFRKELRAAFDAPVAFHLKRLLAESLAATDPVDSDWALLSYLEKSHVQLFWAIFDLAQSNSWYQFFKKHWFARVLANHERANLERWVSKLSYWSTLPAEEVVSFANDALGYNWIEPRSLSGIFSLYLTRLAEFPRPSTDQLLKRLVDLTGGNDYFLSTNLMRFVVAVGGGHELLWEFISHGVDATKMDIGLDLHRIDQKFLETQFVASELFLNKAVASLEVWSRDKSAMPGRGDGFLSSTSYEINHSVASLRHQTDLQSLVLAVEHAVLHHAANDTDWWRANAVRLALNVDQGLRYIASNAITANPQANIDVAAKVLTDPHTYEAPQVYELGRLLNRCIPGLGDSDKEFISACVLGLFSDFSPSYQYWVDEQRLALLDEIPAAYRTADADAEHRRLSEIYPIPDHKPHIKSRSGYVHSPYTRSDRRPRRRRPSLVACVFSRPGSLLRFSQRFYGRC